MNAGKKGANPFTPRFGKIPAHMAGRRDIIDPIIEALEGDPNSPDLTSIFVGARGTGKTALLSYLGNEAGRLGWIAADVSAGPGMLEDVYQRCREAAAHIVEPPRTRRLNRVDVAGVAGAGWENVTAPENWRTRMNGLFNELEEAGAGILITVDEVDPDVEEMGRLVADYQHFVREGKRVALLLAGLPHNVSGIVSGKRTSFLRRASRHELGSIPDYEVEEAFRLTLVEAGRGIGDDALAAAVDAIGGFPFMFQLVGYRSWNAAGDARKITLEAVERGARLAQKELVEKVFDSTYAELSAGDRAMLAAMLQDGAATAQKDLPARLGKSSSYVSNYKKRLLKHGVIEEGPKGMIRFCLPGFREYLAGLED